MTNADNVKLEVDAAAMRKSQLVEIMRDAVAGVLERPISRRGPYVIDDCDLKQSMAAGAGAR
jgi:hypothetical protein